jgi:hypothetical protein
VLVCAGSDIFGCSKVVAPKAGEFFRADGAEKVNEGLEGVDAGLIGGNPEDDWDELVDGCVVVTTGAGELFVDLFPKKLGIEEAGAGADGVVAAGVTDGFKGFPEDIEGVEPDDDEASFTTGVKVKGFSGSFATGGTGTEAAAAFEGAQALSVVWSEDV